MPTLRTKPVNDYAIPDHQARRMDGYTFPLDLDLYSIREALAKWLKAIKAQDMEGQADLEVYMADWLTQWVPAQAIREALRILEHNPPPPDQVWNGEN